MKDTIDLDSDFSPALSHVAKSCSKMAEIDLKDTQKVAALLMETSLKYYGVVQKQAEQSFRWALLFAGVGTLFFIGSSCFLMSAKMNLANITLIGGALIQLISGINFYLYWQTAKQFAGFHICLERMDRYLLSNSYCENLNSGKDDCRRKIIEIMANAPMLTLEQVGVSVARPPRQQDRTSSAAVAH